MPEGANTFRQQPIVRLKKRRDEGPYKSVPMILNPPSQWDQLHRLPRQGQVFGGALLEISDTVCQVSPPTSATGAGGTGTSAAASGRGPSQARRM